MTKKVDAECCQLLRESFNASGLLPGINLANTYKASWIKLYGIKYTKSGVIAVDANGDPILYHAYGYCMVLFTLKWTCCRLRVLTTITKHKSDKA